MLKRFWQWYIRVPADLDLDEKIYLRGLYVICALIALHGLLFLIAAVISNVDVLVRLVFVAAAVVVVAIALALRIAFFWIQDKLCQR